MPRKRALTPEAPAAKAALTRNTRTRVRAANALPDLIRTAHTAGLTWADIGALTGMSGGNAWNLARTQEKAPPVTDDGGEQKHEIITTG